MRINGLEYNKPYIKFAWFPVKIHGEQTIAWLERVEVIKRRDICDEHYYEYYLIDKKGSPNES